MCVCVCCYVHVLVCVCFPVFKFSNEARLSSVRYAEAANKSLWVLMCARGVVRLCTSVCVCVIVSGCHLVVNMEKKQGHTHKPGHCIAMTTSENEESARN